MDLVGALGPIDIYLLDQVLRGHIPEGSVMLDAECGGGRNLHYFFKRGDAVCALDPDPRALAQAKGLAASLGRSVNDDDFRAEPLESTTFESDRFDVVICNAVLHFARDDDHFRAMTTALHCVMCGGGALFLSSGVVDRSRTKRRGLGPPHSPRWHRLPDGTDRFLVDLDFLIGETERLGVRLSDPYKDGECSGAALYDGVWRKC